MFEPAQTPRIFGVPLGVDYPQAVVDELIRRHEDLPPEAIARVQLYVNTERMGRRIKALFAERGALFLPRINLLTKLSDDLGLPAPMPPMRRRLVLAQLVRKLLKTSPDIAPEHAAFDLADSLAKLLDEMQGEGVDFATLRGLDVAGHSAHWERSLRFLAIVETYLAGQSQDLDAEARQRAAVDLLAEKWQENPPQDPVLVVGSTGSRGATAKFMGLVASLPQGAIILPGFDFDMRAEVWDHLSEALSGEDHPQFRFKQFLTNGVNAWGRAEPNAEVRTRLVSLALRPAPVTDAWLTEGPDLGELVSATQDISLVLANSQREEALAIALVLRHAVDENKTAALITPDRDLSRQVTAALDRWGIIPDDSAGLPLHLSPPGRFLRMVAGLFGQALTAESLLILLKHPLTCSVKDLRGAHLRWVRELELHLRRHGPAFPTPADLTAWALASKEDGLPAWIDWINAHLADCHAVSQRSLTEHLQHLMQIANALAGGPQSAAHQLWAEDEGIKAAETMQALLDEADYGGGMAAFEFLTLIQAVLQGAESRSSVEAHPNVMIWGTLEARVQGAELVILGGLNEGIWPGEAAPDPWLNRSLRYQAGLLLPERQIGLAAHDFQQAVAAGQVILTRSIRNAEAETVPSRWVYRLTSLLDGLKGDQAGNIALEKMRGRGDLWLALARHLDQADKQPAAPRPSPCPPVDVRPKLLSVTEIKTLIRDPYAIYAKHVLDLRALDPLRPAPDARLRGTVLHKVLHRFSDATANGLPTDAETLLLDITDLVLAEEIPWPATRRIWRARMARNANWFVETEILRRKLAQPMFFETKGQLALPGLNVEIRGTADRIDVTQDGQLIIYDYKTGSPPSPNQIKHFDKQLLIEAAMAENGGFSKVGPCPVKALTYVALPRNPSEKPINLQEFSVTDAWAGLATLIGEYQARTQGYTSRRAMKLDTDAGDYDHLARFREWSVSDAPKPVKVDK